MENGLKARLSAGQAHHRGQYRVCANLDSALPPPNLYLLMFIFAESSGFRATATHAACLPRGTTLPTLRWLQGASRYEKHESSTSGILIRCTSSLDKSYTASPRAIHSPKSTRSLVIIQGFISDSTTAPISGMFQRSASSTCVGQSLTLSLTSLAPIGCGTLR